MIVLTLDLLHKLTARSVIDYALPVYCKTLKQTENLQYRAAKLVTGAFHYSSKDKLNIELGWETIQKRSDILSLNIFHKNTSKRDQAINQKLYAKT